MNTLLCASFSFTNAYLPSPQHQGDTLASDGAPRLSRTTREARASLESAVCASLRPHSLTCEQPIVPPRYPRGLLAKGCPYYLIPLRDNNARPLDADRWPRWFEVCAVAYANVLLWMTYAALDHRLESSEVLLEHRSWTTSTARPLLFHARSATTSKPRTSSHSISGRSGQIEYGSSQPIRAADSRQTSNNLKP